MEAFDDLAPWTNSPQAAALYHAPGFVAARVADHDGRR